MTFLSILATLLIIIAGLLTMAVGLMLGGYFSKPPQGQNAVGLIVPMGMIAATWLLMLPGAWMVVGRGGFAWVSGDRLMAGIAATVLVIVIGSGSVCSFFAWAENMGVKWRSGGPMVCGIVLPLTLQALMLVCAWRTDLPIHTMRTFAGLLCLPAVAISLPVINNSLNHWAGNQRRMAADKAAFEAKWDRIRSLSPAEKAREAFEKYSPEAPLWTITGFLIDAPDDPELQKLVLDRAAKVPDFEAELASLLAYDGRSLRAGAVEFVRISPDRSPARADGLRAAIAALAKEITAAGGKTAPNWASDFEPEIARVRRAAAAFGSMDFYDSLKALDAASAPVSSEP